MKRRKRPTYKQKKKLRGRFAAIIADKGRPLYRSVEVAQETGSEAAVAYAAGRWEGFIDGLRAVFDKQMVDDIVNIVENGVGDEEVIQ